MHFFFSYFKPQRFLYLEQGQLEGSIPSALGELKNLEVIDLDFNGLVGSIPESIYGLSNLRELDLNNNQLTGTISSQVGLLSNLAVLQVRPLLLLEFFIFSTFHYSYQTYLPLSFVLSSIYQVDHNMLTGEIPAEIGQLEQLAIGFFSYNNLTGTVDKEICALREPNGNLGKLQVDCADEPTPKVECDCCTSCRQLDEQGATRRMIEN